MTRWRISGFVGGAILFLAVLVLNASFARAEFRAGAAVVDVTPTQFPVLVNGGMTSRSAGEVTTPVNARAIVLDDGNERLAIVIVDSCMMPRPLLDDAKALAATKTKIKPDRMLIAATHTHTAPASMGCLGTDADPNYVPFLRVKLAEAIQQAEANLEPARVGFAVTQAPEHTALRRWIRRPDRIAEDPFGNPTVRANMHAGRNWDDVTGESGPEDPDLSLIAIQSRSGRPLAVLANFSMHYFSGQKALAADYFGLFSEGLKVRLANGGDGQAPPFVGIMSHGCSGDIWRKDYKNTEPTEIESGTIEHYTEGLLDFAVAAYQSIEYQSDADLAMAEARMTLNYRVPNKQLLEWSERIIEEMGDRLPKTTAEVYAREQLILHERQSTEIVVQALRIGEIGIATTPNETYALTGLKIKLNSPLEKTMVIELANGGDGYIPPPEQHLLGGYNTWPARSAGLEVMAEPKIAETGLRLLEEVAGSPRRPFRQTRGPAAEQILQARPLAYWRLDEMAGPRAIDVSPNRIDAIYEPPVAFFLDGPRSEEFTQPGETNRAAHFAGGRLSARLPELGENYTVALWFWNGLPVEARSVSGWLVSRDRNHGLTAWGDHLGVGGGDHHPGKLIFRHGRGESVAGTTAIPRWTWNHVVLVRTADEVMVYLNGQQEIRTKSPLALPDRFEELFLGGRSDNDSNWEGRLDEIAVFDRALSADEISRLVP
jgi:hypothetical protein